MRPSGAVPVLAICASDNAPDSGTNAKANPATPAGHRDAGRAAVGPRSSWSLQNPYHIEVKGGKSFILFTFPRDSLLAAP
jgi:hypothetical protein